MERKALQFELKANKGKRQIEGYASTYEKDLVGDVVQKGAFSKTIAERFPTHQIKILWQHDSNFPIGLPIAIEEDSKGLHVVGKLTEGVQKADEALALIEAGVIDTFSIGYDVIKDELSDDGQTRYLKELRLYEFSPVTFPANPTAKIESVRKDIDPISEFTKEELHMLFKEGRVLSRKSRSAIETAITQLQEILNIDGKVEKAFRADPDHSKDFEPNYFTQLLTDMQSFTNNLKK